MDRIHRYLLRAAGFNRIDQAELAAEEWPRLPEVALIERLLLRVADRLNELESEPGDWKAQLAEMRFSLAGQALVLQHQLLIIVDALKLQGIDSVPLKGPALAQRLYGDVTRRQFLDLDLLVLPRDLDQAIRVLEHLGYQVTQLPEPGVDHDVSLARQVGAFAVKLELHIAVNFGNHPSFPQTWWDARVPLELNGQTVSFFRDDHLLVFLCLHAARHGYSSWGWLAEIADLFRDLRCTHDEMIQAAREAGLMSAVYYSLWLVNRMGADDVPPSLLAALRPKRNLSRVLWFLVNRGSASRANYVRLTAMIAIGSQGSLERWFVPSFLTFRKRCPQLSTPAARLLYVPWLVWNIGRAGVALVRAGLAPMRG